jgi:subfamily B ATP-binding cassette protein MsbA
LPLQPKNDTSLTLLRRVARIYLRPYIKTLALALVLMVIAAATTGALAKMMEPVIDKVFSMGDRRLIFLVGIGVLSAFTLRGATTYLYTVLMNKIGQGVVRDLQVDLFRHIIRTDIAFFHATPVGQLTSRFMSDVVYIRTMAIESLVNAVKNGLTVFFLITVMFIQDWRLAMVAIFIFPLAAFYIAKLGKKLRKISGSVQNEVGELASVLTQSFQGVRHIKAYAMEAHEEARVLGTFNTIYRLWIKNVHFSALAAPVTEVLSGLAIVMIIIYGGIEISAGHSTPGKLFSFIAAFLMAFDPLKRLAKLNGIVQTGIASTMRIFSILDMPATITDKENAAVLNAPRPEITFEHVSFRYADGTVALDDLSLTIPAGKKVAFVGTSGAGKSTALNLIPRFYDVTAGRILINGIDIRDVSLQSLREHMALVSQEISIFNDTVRENIGYGRQSATEDEIIHAAKAAAAHDFIMALPHGYDTKMGEQGVKLSGGQRQRIAIARAVLKNAPILLLDEATSALDTESERTVQEALELLQQGRTTIVVAHRLSTIKNADIIYVLKDGKIAEQGSHDTLFNLGGIYTNLYTHS